MQDYRLDAIERPERHAAAVNRLTGRRRNASVDYSGGEQPGRKVDGRPLKLCPCNFQAAYCIDEDKDR